MFFIPVVKIGPIGSLDLAAGYVLLCDLFASLSLIFGDILPELENEISLLESFLDYSITGGFLIVDYFY